MRRTVVIFLLITTMLLSGCLYPNNRLAKNQVPNDVQVDMVQEAVDQYVEQTQGLVPINTKPEDTPIFQKYILDFAKLKEYSLISSVPGTAFENGGNYQYTLITPEENPTVKVIDLRIAETIRELNFKINAFRSEHIYPPFGEPVTNFMYEIDYKKLGLEQAPFIVSPYSGNNIPILISAEGELAVDYRSDLYQVLEEQDHHYQEGDDIRYLLTDYYPFVPAYSIPYTLQDGEPVFAPNLPK
ncbi:hypothetical protein KO561_10380 [Radiobacillus kanasensis]|uniref:hypothetical protein n=1 Tax=Radiobacillus kanasensis TaxID=2844358 RepID=UPI001E3580D3|nr:hypothetical protein [Radiobacillus kanasensis]UFT97632.1 hypothetical protein KO561_10380 [Radiobacillus kanasensis]